jgi:FKBP-type peptidyl-prolyl cis-trans isomerase (trigger factor)
VFRSGPRRRGPDDRDPAPAERPLRGRALRTATTLGVDFTGTIRRGVSRGQPDFPIVIGEGRMLPEFEIALTGMAAVKLRHSA